MRLENIVSIPVDWRLEQPREEAEAEALIPRAQNRARGERGGERLRNKFRQSSQTSDK